MEGETREDEGEGEGKEEGRDGAGEGSEEGAGEGTEEEEEEQEDEEKEEEGEEKGVGEGEKGGGTAGFGPHRVLVQVGLLPVWHPQANVISVRHALRPGVPHDQGLTLVHFSAQR